MVAAAPSILVDTSAVMAVLFDEPIRGAVIAATEERVVIAPASIPWEVGNAIMTAVRRRRLPMDRVEAVWDAFAAMELREVDVDVAAALALAVEHSLYAYDGYVLEAAIRHRQPLLTLDARLAAAARAARATVFGIES